MSFPLDKQDAAPVGVIVAVFSSPWWKDFVETVTQIDSLFVMAVSAVIGVLMVLSKIRAYRIQGIVEKIKQHQLDDLEGD